MRNSDHYYLRIKSTGCEVSMYNQTVWKSNSWIVSYLPCTFDSACNLQMCAKLLTWYILLLMTEHVCVLTLRNYCNYIFAYCSLLHNFNYHVVIVWLDHALLNLSIQLNWCCILGKEAYNNLLEHSEIKEWQHEWNIWDLTS